MSVETFAYTETESVSTLTGGIFQGNQTTFYGVVGWWTSITIFIEF